MKRFLMLSMILELVAGSVATAEAERSRPKRVERTVEGSYATQFVPFNVRCQQHGGVGCVKIETRKNEEFLTATAVDAHGQPVLVQVWGTVTPESGYWVEHGSFCGETDKPIAFDRGADVYLVVGYFWITDLPTSLRSCPPMFGTTGTITVTLSNVP